MCIGAILDVDVETAQASFNTNFFAVLRMVRAVVPGMAARENGLVMNIGSIVSMIPVPFQGMYGATKAALASATETLLLECKPLGVSVMLVEPGGIKSRIAENASEYTLPATSLYKSFIPVIHSRLTQAPGVIDCDVFARHVVKCALPSSTLTKGGLVDFSGVRWYHSMGYLSTVVWVMNLLPRSWTLWVLTLSSK